MKGVPPSARPTGIAIFLCVTSTVFSTIGWGTLLGLLTNWNVNSVLHVNWAFILSLVATTLLVIASIITIGPLRRSAAEYESV